MGTLQNSGVSHENYFEDLEAQFESELQKLAAPNQRRQGQLDYDGPSTLVVRTQFSETIRLVAPVIGHDFCAGISQDRQHFIILANAGIADLRVEKAEEDRPSIVKTADELCDFIDRFADARTQIKLSFLAQNQTPVIGWLVGRYFGLVEVGSGRQNQLLFPIATIGKFEFFACE